MKCVLFDFDMTLADSSYSITDAVNMIAQSRGLRSVTREEILRVIGLPIAESWMALWGAFDESWLDEYREKFVPMEYKGLRLFPGAREVLESLRGLGMRLGVASNRRNVLPALEATDIAQYFAAGVRGIGVESGNFKAADLLEAWAWRAIPSVVDLPALAETGNPSGCTFVPSRG